MRKPSTRAIVTKPATDKAAKTIVAKAATKARAIVAKPVTPIAAPVAAPAVAKPSGNITRTAATITRQAGAVPRGLSDRDTAYLAFYKRLAAKQSPVTLAGIVASGERPAHIGSNKPHDADVINRLNHLGLIAKSADGHSFTVTPLGASTKAS